jgi:hypothetical protein
LGEPQVFFLKKWKVLRITWYFFKNFGRQNFMGVKQISYPLQDTYAKKISLVLMGGWAEVQVCADPGARTPIGASENFYITILVVNKTIYSFVGMHSFFVIRQNLYNIQSICVDIHTLFVVRQILYNIQTICAGIHTVCIIFDKTDTLQYTDKMCRHACLGCDKTDTLQ